MATHHRTCPLCEAMCGLRIETDGDRVASIRGDRDDPLSRGYLCPKGPALKALHEDPDRLRHPVRRVGDRWERIGWDEALDLAADGLHAVQEAHGRDAVAVYLGNPTVHNLGAALFAPMLVRALRTKNRFSATSVDQLPHHLAAHLMFGHQFLLPIPDVDRTDHLLVFGANPLASNGSLMSAPDMKGRIAAIQARGGKVVVVDPRRSETARVADEHVFVRPGTDAWLLAAILHVAFARGRGLGRLAGSVERVAEARRAVESIPPARAAGPTGVPTATIERLADELCAAERGVCYGRVGVSTQRFGALCQWLVNAINLVTGHFDREGGAMFTSPAVDAVAAPFGLGVGRGSFGRWTSRVRGLPETGGELPVATLADEILTEGPGQVRALVTHAGNPVLSTPNGRRLDEALEGLEHVVAIDFYVNETTRHAHVILPPPSPLERWHYDVAFHVLAVRNTAKLSPPLFAPGDGALRDHELLLGLIDRLDAKRGGGWRAKAQRAALRRLGPEGLVDLGLRVGPYGVRAWPPRKGLSAKALLREPHGVDLGPLVPCLPERMQRWRARIDLAPAPLVDDLDRLAAESPAEGLSLIGRRHLRSNNSWMHNAPKLMAGKPRCTLMMHPSDAAARGLEDGQTVEARSRVGAVRVPVEVTDEVMEGVVSLPHGFGHDRPGVRLSVARAHPGASVNDLTDERYLDDLCGNAALSGVAVEVAPAGDGAG
ncbi:MAG TPA: molybdopterin-dependent oxidoreductase [Sandaracinaceae bacterium LLY-WYZ-13_1]|nr:molybdopterin-dependent oxidoreductase [Sandaracinaceae bacterium LLY-WYZ-13_1]